jgi:hypothetical protein
MSPACQLCESGELSILGATSNQIASESRPSESVNPSEFNCPYARVIDGSKDKRWGHSPHGGESSDSDVGERFCQPVRSTEQRCAPSHDIVNQHDFLCV